MIVYKLTSIAKVQLKVKSVTVIVNTIDEAIKFAREVDPISFKEIKNIKVEFIAQSTPKIINVEYK